MATRPSRRIAEEQAALRRVATLVAGGAAPEAVFAAVTAEVGRLLEVDFAVLTRCDRQATITTVGKWSSSAGTSAPPAASRLRIGGRNVTTMVCRTGRPARMDYAEASGAIGAVATSQGFRSSVGVPITVEGRLWGVMIVALTRDKLLPAGTEARLTEFTELVATAIANAQARAELRDFTDEQVALRRMAMLVARAAPAEEVFAGVAEEVGRLLGSDYTVLSRYDADGVGTVVGSWTSSDLVRPLANGFRLAPGGQNLNALLFQTRRPVRIDDYDEAWGPGADFARTLGLRSAVGMPISVEGRLWGGISVTSRCTESLPPDTEARLAGFTELVATAIANAEAQAALTASRARIVATADTTRRRIERNLHDGAQQRLVSLALQLRTARAAVPPTAGELAQQLDDIADELTGVLDELREIARGLHPATLAEGGLRPALKTLAHRSPVPVHLDLHTDARFPEPIEIAAYYAVSEALTNAAKHAAASAVDVEVNADDSTLRVRVRDNGRGGADPTRGSGIVGLQDRVEALGGGLSLRSPPGGGTTVEIALPLAAPGGPVAPVDQTAPT
ncbi:sensor histidine kinase [Dactylosporangium sp. CA-233914]|uniref:sensor histidine kinase n=1 Tax=Dactylosporangium sp. CA-233914 TaxID=3239934 RepID=UPI003D93695F